MSFFSTAFSLLVLISFTSPKAGAMDFDWHGDFRAETNTLFGYSHGQTQSTAVPANGNGYFIPQSGESPASFQNLFFRLKPRAIVNDNITIYSEIWFGSADQGMFGSDQPSKSYYYGSTTGTASIAAKTFYTELATDFGTITVGRAPLNWGLGLIWNNQGGVFDRLPSTGDTIRMVTKLGAFKFIPAMTKYRLGTNYGGSLGSAGAGSTRDGWSGAADYTVGLTYENADEQINLGVQFMRRLSGINAQVADPLQLDGANNFVGYQYNVWDFYAKKKSGIFTVSAEVPLITGKVGNYDYATVAGAVNVDAQVNDHWNVKVNLGSADGQDSMSPTGNPTKVTAFYFHPDYRPGFLMFNYNYRNLSTASASPYDNPVTNARFLAVDFDYHLGKWNHGFQGVYAIADKACDGVAGNRCYNTWDRAYKTENGSAAQEKGLGMELDYLLAYQWDDAFRIGLNTGLYFPGKFYAFSNSATLNNQKTVFGTSLNMSVQF